MKIAVVVPTNRPRHLTRWLEAWESELMHNDAKLYVVHDEPAAWEKIEADLGERAWIIQRKGAGIRCYGFLQALRDGADIIVTYDDDVKPIRGCLEQHVRNLTGTRHENAWAVTTRVVRTRGLPYANFDRTLLPGISHGLWSGVPDLDGMTQLVLPWARLEPHGEVNVVPRGHYFTMCSMNMGFVREMAPAMYFPLMGAGVPYDRFDDIWCGIIAKKVADHVGRYCTNGAPFVEHARASDAFVNMQKEASGIVENERFWKLIDEVILTEETVDGCMQDIAVSLDRLDDHYYRQLAQAIVCWTNLIAEAAC